MYALFMCEAIYKDSECVVTRCMYNCIVSALYGIKTTVGKTEKIEKIYTPDMTLT